MWHPPPAPTSLLTLPTRHETRPHLGLMPIWEQQPPPAMRQAWPVAERCRHLSRGRSLLPTAPRHWHRRTSPPPRLDVFARRRPRAAGARGGSGGSGGAGGGAIVAPPVGVAAAAVVAGPAAAVAGGGAQDGPPDAVPLGGRTPGGGGCVRWRPGRRVRSARGHRGELGASRSAGGRNTPTTSPPRRNTWAPPIHNDTKRPSHTTRPARPRLARHYVSNWS